jgi:hypothetical protein
MKIRSLAQYCEEIRLVIDSWNGFQSTTLPWFRGQIKKEWDLIPSLYRNDSNIDPSLESNLLRDFKNLVTLQLTHLPSLPLEWLFVMQHHGLPTRLLDWTEGHLIALFFAVLGPHDLSDGAVWIFDPWSLNKKVIKLRTVPSSNYFQGIEEYYMPSYNREGNMIIKANNPIAIRPSRITQRILSQKGVFTLHGNEKVSLNSFANVENKKTEGEKQFIRYAKLVIDANSKKSILKELFLAGVGHSICFPSLDGISAEIAYRYSRDFIGDDPTKSE